MVVECGRYVILSVLRRECAPPIWTEHNTEHKLRLEMVLDETKLCGETSSVFQTILTYYMLISHISKRDILTLFC